MNATLIDAAKHGDRAAFEAAVIRPYQGPIYSHCYRFLGGDADLAEDITQDTFIRAWGAFARTAPDTNVSAWLYRIAANLCLDKLRRRQRLRWLPWEGPRHDHLLIATKAERPEVAVERAETETQVQDVLDRLTPTDRLVLILREFDGLSCEEIGQVIGVSRSAVKSRLFRAREHFRAIWRDTYGPPLF